MKGEFLVLAFTDHKGRPSTKLVIADYANNVTLCPESYWLSLTKFRTYSHRRACYLCQLLVNNGINAKIFEKY